MKLAVGFALLMVLLPACALGGGTATTTPKPSASPSSSPCPVEAVPGLRVRGCVIVKEGGNLDLDSGHINVSTYDIAFSQGVLNVASGTAFNYLGVTDFDSVTPPTILSSNLRSDGYRLDQLRSGGVLAVRTGQGHPSKVRLETVGSSSLNLSFLTYDAASVPTPSHATPTPSHTTTTHSPTPTPTKSQTSTSPST